MMHNGRRISTCLWLIGISFALIGCGGLYRAAGLDEQQVAEQVEKDQVVTVKVLEQAREIFWPIVSAAIAAVGAILTTLLGRWLGAERKLTAAVIRGVEISGGNDVKKSVQAVAMKNGVETQLSRRVQALT